MTAFVTDFFVCYASADGGEAARGIVADLEARDVKCWIAPRDIPLGVTWAKAIVGGIESSHAMLLIVTKASNTSEEVEKEVSLAVHLHKTILPIRIIDVSLSGSLLYQLQTRQWRDLFVDRDATIIEIVAQIRSIRSISSPAVHTQEPKNLALINTEQPTESDNLAIVENLLANRPEHSGLMTSSETYPLQAENLSAVPEESGRVQTIPATGNQSWGPVWATAAFAGVILLGSYLYLRNVLSGQTEALAIKMAEVHPNTDLSIPRETAGTQLQRIRAALASEILAGKVDAVQSATTIFIRIGNAVLFPSGGAKVDDSFAPIAAKIAAALDHESGAIHVDGYTDSDPIQTVEFPSNLELSEARAKSVAAMLGRGLANPERIAVSARRDDNPVADNDVEQNKSRNRRVEVSIPRAD